MAKKSKIIVTFDKTTGFPSAKARYCTKEQLADAGLLLRGESVKRLNGARNKNNTENKVHKFFRCLFGAIFASSIKNTADISAPFPSK